MNAKVAALRESGAGKLLELAVVVAVAALLAVGVQAFIVKPYRIPSGSMEPTLKVGQRVLVNRIAMDFSEPHVGGIYVFHPPTSARAGLCGPAPHAVLPGGAACSQPAPREASETFVKRLVGAPGDEIYLARGHVFRRAAGTSSFRPEPDAYIKACGEGADCNFPRPIRVPAGHWFMMGDNRGDSDDSRFWGPVPTGWIVGEAFFTYWPPDRVGIL